MAGARGSLEEVAMGELDIYARQGFGNRLGFGQRPALLIVDFVNGFNDADQFGGGNIGAAIERTKGLLAAARARRVPIAYSRVVYADDGSDHGMFTRKAPSLTKLTETAAGSRIVPDLAPRAGECIVRKTQASAFFGTDLLGWLTLRRVDTIVVAGCTTSGCVRATVVDALSYNFIPVVVTDCVGDRAIGPHEANLFDMGQKYADLMTRDQVIGKIDRTATAA